MFEVAPTTKKKEFISGITDGGIDKVVVVFYLLQ